MSPEEELTREFEKPLVKPEGPNQRVQLTLTPWEIKILVERAIRWHKARIEGFARTTFGVQHDVAE